MNIGKAAAASGVTAKMIRHYEGIGLIRSVAREASNYRVYSVEDVRQLRFVRRARSLGFSIERIRGLLRLWSDRNRCSSEVKAIALAHVEELDRKIGQMREMADELHALAHACDGDDRPDCPILRSLEGAPVPDRAAAVGG